MKKISALILLTAGLLCVFYSGWRMWETRHSQESALRQAKAITNDAQISTTRDHKAVPSAHSIDKDIIGLLEVPRLKAELPVIEGTSDEQLEKGVGHYKSSALPGLEDQIVLSGHRDTVFRRFGELKKGDKINLKFKNKVYTYVIDRTKIVKADDLTIIHSSKPKEELVLTTCFPFNFIGNAPERYIIYAYPKKA